MKILFCTNAFETVSNGPAKFSHLLLQINTLFPGHEIRILTEDCTAASANVFKLELNIPRWLKPAGMFLRMFQYHRRAMEIRKNEFPFDTLVYNNAIVAVWSGWRFHNTIGFINDDNNASASWRKAFFQLQFTRNHIFFLVEKLATKVTRKTVVNSDYLLHYLKARYHIPSGKIFRLYKAIEFQPQPLRKQNPVPSVLFVKNDYIRGGLFDLIAALKSLRRPCRLIIAGTPASASQSILAACNDSLLEVTIAGIIPQNQVYQLMQQADIFCVPSYKEALGVANIEAMAHGCSVISTRVGGIPEVMDQGACGWLADAGDVAGLADAITDCLENEAIREQKKNHAYTYIQRFSLSNMLNELMGILSINGRQ